VIENSASAVEAAAAAGYGVEVDVQLSGDGEAVVFHDETLDRLTAEHGSLAARTAGELTGIPLSGSAAGDRIWRLSDLLELVGGRVPLIVEMKSRWDGDAGLAPRVAALLARYEGAVAAKSFDPAAIAALRQLAPTLPRGIIGCRFEASGWGFLPAAKRFGLRNLTHWPMTRPDFLSWRVHDLPNRPVGLAGRLGRIPVMAGTIREPAEQARAMVHADQMLFEGFCP
jgi:glycerophosphoryl diester phosphodiesterase